jgi:uncharacterized membrane protein
LIVRIEGSVPAPPVSPDRPERPGTVPRAAPGREPVIATITVMPTSRLEAFSDGVLAIIITIMVLELHVPDRPELSALLDESGTGLLTYLLSFIYIGIYWNNHHHMFQVTKRITGGVLWANLHLLFWLSLLPFTTAWVDGSGFARVPTIAYGVDLCAAAIAYFLLQSAIVHGQGPDSALRRAVGRDAKGKLSPVFYLTAIAIALFAEPAWRPAIWLSMACYVTVAVWWLVPDRRIERYLAAREKSPAAIGDGPAGAGPAGSVTGPPGADPPDR